MLTISAIVALIVWIGSVLLNRPKLTKELAASLRLLVAENFPVNQNIHISFENTGLRFPDLVAAAQLQLDHILQQKNIPFRYTLVDDLSQTFYSQDSVQIVESKPMIITVDSESTGTTENATETELPVVPDRTKPTYEVSLALSNSVAIYHDIYALKVIMSYDLDAVHKNDMPFFVAQAVLDHLLAVDFATAEKIKNASFSDYKPVMQVNFVAAEDLGNTPNEIITAISSHFADLKKRLYPFLNFNFSFIPVDVTKNRLRSDLTKNATCTLNFVYLTSLLGFVDVIQGVPIHHMSSAPVENFREEEVLYGTELLKKQQQLTSSTYNITSFVESATSAIIETAGLPALDADNLNIQCESAMKYYTLIGIVEELDRITENFSESEFMKVAKLVDHILTQDEHDWHKYLLQVGEWHK